MSTEDTQNNVFGRILTTVKKIAVLRSNALGDFFFAYPALCALRQTYKDAEIVYLGNPWHKDFLESRPSPISSVTVIPPSEGVRKKGNNAQDERELNTFFAKMRQERFDIAIQIHGGGKNSNPFINHLGAKLTIGLRTNDAELLDRWIPYDMYQNEFAKYMEVVGLIGVKPVTLHPLLSVTEEDIVHAKKHISKKPFIVLHPGASDARRRWPEKYFAQVGDSLATMGYDIIITGTTPEKEIVHNITSHMRKPAVNLCGKIDLSTLTGILSLSKLVISNDTGPLHLADAIGAKTVGIYWVGNAISSSPLVRKGRAVLFSWTLLCPVCKISCLENACNHKVSFVAEIYPDKVLKVASQLLDQ